MFEEGLVFGGGDSLHHDGGNFCVGQVDAALAGEGVEGGAVCGAQGGGERRLVVGEACGIGEAAADEDPEQEGCSKAKAERDGAADEQGARQAEQEGARAVPGGLEAGDEAVRGRARRGGGGVHGCPLAPPGGEGQGKAAVLGPQVFPCGFMMCRRPSATPWNRLHISGWWAPGRATRNF
jgi:hypothetical protein